jgi:hypothetical protein
MPDNNAPHIIFENQGGMNTTMPPDALKPGSYPYLQNTRKLLSGRMTARPPLGSNLIPSALPSGVTSLTRMNDPYAPSPHYVRVIGAAGVMYVESTSVATGLSTNPLSFLPYRPSESPRPWCYVADPSLAVTIPSGGISPGYAAYGTVCGMLKVRSDGTVYKTGIKEPQIAPAIVASTVQGVTGVTIVTPGSGQTDGTYPITGVGGGGTLAQVTITISGGQIITASVTNAGSGYTSVPTFPVTFGGTPGTLLATIGAVGPNWVTYRNTYRSSVTGAVSNPSPESPPQIVPQTSGSKNAPTGTGSSLNSSQITINSSQYEYNNFGGANEIRTTGSVGAGVVTDYIVARNLGFAIPTGVNIDGVLSAMTWNGQNSGTGIITSVALFYQGQIIGQVKSPGIANSQSISTSTQGGDSDSWGTVLTSEIVNDTTFGIGFQITTQSSGGSTRSFITNFTATIYFTILSASVTATPSLDPQVDTIDYYRMTPSLDNFTYAGSTPNAQGVTGVTIVTPGSGQTPGTYNINGVGGGGIGAIVQIVISSGGIITTASVTNAGSGYTSVPTFPVTFGGTPGTLLATIGGFADTQSDLAIAGNPILSFENYEPFPSIDLPRSGICTVGANGAVTSTGGTDVFNVRWLPGNLINIAGIVYTLYNRPTSTTALIAVTTTTSDTGFLTYGYPPTGTVLPWNITVPTLAAEPSPVIWGPTPDNAGSFYFGLDPNNQGDLLWSMGNNFDSAPDTNRLYVTSPNEPLMNGTVTSELSTVFSTDRFWLIYPNFADAVATVTGTLGSQWTLVQSAATRGLYMRYAIAALGSLIGWRAKDGIFISKGGEPEQDISGAIYNLFPHSGQTPSAVTVGGNTVYPPDDTKPNAQTIAMVPGYIFYNYQDTTSTPRTLVYDMEAKGWSVDVYNPTVNYHAWAAGDVYQILTGCSDGTVRQFDSTATETATAVIATPCINSGDVRAQKRLGDVYIKALITASNPVALALYANRYALAMSGYSPTSLTGTGILSPYVIDFTAGIGNDLLDVAAQLSWPVGSGDVLDSWEPHWTSLLPDSINDRPTEWNNGGFPGNKLIRGFVLELDTFNTPKTFNVERSDDNTLRTPDQIPITVNGQTLTPFTFVTPFTAHDLRLISTDGVAWRRAPDAEWGMNWIFDQWPEYAPLRSAWSNLGVQGAKYLRGLVVPMDTNSAVANFTVVTSDGGSVSFSATTPAAKKTVVSFAFNPPIVAHDVQLQMNSNAAVWTEEIRWDADPYPEIIPEYTSILETGGAGAKYFRGLTLTADTAGVSTSFVIQYDGGTVGPTFTGTFNGKQTKAFAFTPFVFHDIQIIPQANARIWIDQSKWDFDPYPELVPEYTPIMEFGGSGAKYMRGVTVTGDSANSSVSLQVLYDGGQTGPVLTASFNGKQTKAFSFTPFVAHDVQLVPNASIRIWVEEGKWDFDPYPEIIPEYTPIMEVGGSGNKYVRGINITADTANVPVAFQVLYDGGQTGPLTTATAFNGKQTVSFAFDPPFVAHDLQIVPQSSARIFLTESKWILDPWAEYTTIYSPWMNLDRQEPKYIRSLTLPLDTKGISASLTVVSSDGDSVSFNATTAAGVKTPVGFAFVPPIVAHEVQIRMNSAAAMWPEEAQWEADPYPEIIPAYTPIMEVNGSGAKLVRGLNITGDTANVSTSFVVSYDGGQTGPTVTSAFNGKQTKAFAFTPFIAHDIQLIPQTNARIWIEESKWDIDPWPEYTALYSAWMNVGTNGAKYFRSLVLPMDTNGAAAVVNIVTSDGATIPLPATTTPSGVKTQVAFAFDPPFIAHELRFVPQNPVGLWAAEAKFDFDEYPEIIPEYTPIMEVGGVDNKFVQGVKLIADTANIPVTFQVLYDGGQTGPTFTGTFNGKQTLVFSWPPFLAHDIQLVPQANARIWYGGVGQGESAWQYQPFPEMATNWTTEITALGGKGWQFLRYMDIPYLSTSAVTITFTVDTGNGSIAPQTIILPSSGGTQTKSFTQLTPNKWRLIGFSATSSAPFSLWLPELEVIVRSWGVDNGSFRVEKPFGGPSSPGASV